MTGGGVGSGTGGEGHVGLRGATGLWKWTVATDPEARNHASDPKKTKKRLCKFFVKRLKSKVTQSDVLTLHHFFWACRCPPFPQQEGLGGYSGEIRTIGEMVGGIGGKSGVQSAIDDEIKPILTTVWFISGHIWLGYFTQHVKMKIYRQEAVLVNFTPKLQESEPKHTVKQGPCVSISWYAWNYYFRSVWGFAVTAFRGLQIYFSLQLQLFFLLTSLQLQKKSPEVLSMIFGKIVVFAFKTCNDFERIFIQFLADFWRFLIFSGAPTL